MKTALLLVWYFALPVLLVACAVIAAAQGDWSVAGVCALLGVLAAGRGLVS